MQILKLITYFASFMSVNFSPMGASLSQETLTMDLSVSISKNLETSILAPEGLKYECIPGSTLCFELPPVRMSQL